MNHAHPELDQSRKGLPCLISFIYFLTLNMEINNCEIFFLDVLFVTISAKFVKYNYFKVKDMSSQLLTELQGLLCLGRILSPVVSISL